MMVFFLETAGVLAIARAKIREGRKEDSKTGEDGQIVQMTRSTHRKEWWVISVKSGKSNWLDKEIVSGNKIVVHEKACESWQRGILGKTVENLD
jgi:hypothetical protein